MRRQAATAAVPPLELNPLPSQLTAAGVDIVHGHSSHHAKGAEVYAGRLVLYGKRASEPAGMCACRAVHAISTESQDTHALDSAGAGDLISDYEGISVRLGVLPVGPRCTASGAFGCWLLLL